MSSLNKLKKPAVKICSGGKLSIPPPLLQPFSELIRVYSFTDNVKDKLEVENLVSASY
jgi:hypothetical protein